MEGSVVIARPRRWDNPFSWEMTEAELDRILATEPFDSMEEASFPPSASLRDIIRNDTRIGRYGHGDIIVRAGDYGNSTFLILSGKVRVALAQGLPEAVLGRAEAPRTGVAEALRQSLFGPRLPEI